jgi:hypothetical protein
LTPPGAEVTNAWDSNLHFPRVVRNTAKIQLYLHV